MSGVTNQWVSEETNLIVVVYRHGFLFHDFSFLCLKYFNAYIDNYFYYFLIFDFCYHR